jgi:thiosulfate dehydrogenase
VYQNKCQSCHGTNGQGQVNADGYGYTYPPLWGAHSYNSGAGLFRISRFAGYVKNAMPLGVDYETTQLSDEESWDVAAFVNSQPRPSKDLTSDWPNISKKPVDHPFGPYSDGFSEEQHKYGPFEPIIAARKKQASARK